MDRPPGKAWGPARSRHMCLASQSCRAWLDALATAIRIVALCAARVFVYMRMLRLRVDVRFGLLAVADATAQSGV